MTRPHRYSRPGVYGTLTSTYRQIMKSGVTTPVGRNLTGPARRNTFFRTSDKSPEHETIHRPAGNTPRYCHPLHRLHVRKARWITAAYANRHHTHRTPGNNPGNLFRNRYRYSTYNARSGEHFNSGIASKVQPPDVLHGRDRSDPAVYRVRPGSIQLEYQLWPFCQLECPGLERQPAWR